MTAFGLIAAEKANHPISVMCRMLEVSRSGFHAWERRAPSDRALADAWLTEKIGQIHAENRRVYGSPRVHAELGMTHGIRVGRKRVERLMRQAGLSGLVPKRRGRTTVAERGNSMSSSRSRERPAQKPPVRRPKQSLPVAC